MRYRSCSSCVRRRGKQEAVRPISPPWTSGRFPRLGVQADFPALNFRPISPPQISDRFSRVGLQADFPAWHSLRSRQLRQKRKGKGRNPRGSFFSGATPPIYSRKEEQLAEDLRQGATPFGIDALWPAAFWLKGLSTAASGARGCVEGTRHAGSGEQLRGQLSPEPAHCDCEGPRLPWRFPNKGCLCASGQTSASHGSLRQEVL